MTDSSDGQGGPDSGRGLPGPLSGVFRGTLTRLEVEQGPWVLEADAGARYELLGVPMTATRLAGQVIRVTGRLAADVMTSAQVGPVIEVADIVADD